jgi:hypothetical protein
MCLEPETDRAYAIIVGRLPDTYGGDADVAFAEIWRSVHRLLLQPPY